MCRFVPLCCVVYALLKTAFVVSFPSTPCEVTSEEAFCSDTLLPEELSRLHYILPKSIKRLFISYQKLFLFPTCNFRDFTGLTSLSLTYTDLEVTPRNLSSCLPSVENLMLNDNKLKSIAEQSFVGYENIKSLRLHRNQIREIPAWTFQSMPSLQELWLSGPRLKHNKVQHISPNAFCGLKNLKTLNLNNNNLTEISNGVFSNLQNLRYLNLQENSIERIAGKAFQNLSAHVINLRSNCIQTVYKDTFKFSQVNQLNLAENPLNCSCQTISSLGALNAYGKCRYPRNLRDKEISEILSVERDDCNPKRMCRHTCHNNTSDNEGKHATLLKPLYIALITLAVFSVCVAIICVSYKTYKSHFRARQEEFQNLNVILESFDQVLRDNTSIAEEHSNVQLNGNIPSNDIKTSNINAAFDV